jgi:hypothetical protein
MLKRNRLTVPIRTYLTELQPSSTLYPSYLPPRAAIPPPEEERPLAERETRTALLRLLAQTGEGGRNRADALG